jgi:cytochrome c-type biogenesis protein CcmF
VQSVHAFAETDVGWVFLLYIGIVSSLTILLIAYRWQELRPERQLESYFSREAAFLFNNLALLGICFSTFWGVLFPIFSEAVAGEKSVVGPPFFNQVNIPLFLALLFLMGVGPLIAWRRSNRKALVKTLSRPLIAGSIVTAIFLWLDPTKVSAAIAFGLAVFVFATIEAEMRRAVKIRRQMVDSESLPSAFYQVVRRKPRRYGGLMVHLGIAVMAIAITASMAYQIERDISLVKGKSVEVGRYSLTLEELSQDKFENYSALIAKVRVDAASDGSLLGYMHPERRAYVVNEEVTTEVDLRVTPREDLYLALAGLDVSNAPNSHGEMDLNSTPALMKVFINPLQVWLWFGGVLVMIGTGMVLLQGAFGYEPVRSSRSAVVSGQSGAKA